MYYPVIWDRKINWKDLHTAFVVQPLPLFQFKLSCYDQIPHQKAFKGRKDLCNFKFKAIPQHSRGVTVAGFEVGSHI